MRWKIITCCLILCCISSSAGYETNLYSHYTLSALEVNQEVGEAFNPLDYLLQNGHPIKEGKGDVQIDGNVNVNKLGDYDITFNGHLKMKVHVVDTTAPDIIADDITLDKGVSFVWDNNTLQSIHLSDNYTSEEILMDNLICDTIDTSSSGLGYVTCFTKDESGNEGRLAVPYNIRGSETTQTPKKQQMPQVPIEPLSDQVLNHPQANFTSREEDEILEVFRLVNVERSKAGLPQIRLADEDLQGIAFIRAYEVQVLYSHTRPNNKSCFTILSDYNYRFQSAGENIAKGQQSPNEVVSDWMNSPTHRKNILNANFTTLALAVRGEGGNKVWVQIFMN